MDFEGDRGALGSDIFTALLLPCFIARAGITGRGIARRFFAAQLTQRDGSPGGGACDEGLQIAHHTFEQPVHWNTRPRCSGLAAAQQWQGPNAAELATSELSGAVAMPATVHALAKEAVPVTEAVPATAEVAPATGTAPATEVAPKAEAAPATEAAPALTEVRSGTPPTT